MGKLFEEATKQSLEISITERIWGVIQEVVIAIAKLFALTEENIYEVLINNSDELTHLCDIYRLKLDS